VQTASARVNLLPPEIEQGKRAAAIRRLIVGAAIVSVLAVVGAIGFTAFLAAGAQARLLDAQNETLLILAEQNQYVEVRAIEQKVAAIQSAQFAGTVTEIDLVPVIRSIDAVTPAGTLIATFNLDSASPILDFPPPTTPLERPRVATLLLIAIVPSVDSVAQWVTGLKQLDGYSDVTVNAITLDDATGTYQAAIALNLNATLYRGRFQPVNAPGTESTESGGETTEQPAPGETPAPNARAGVKP
jgi:hypothetical protein